jgi:hypothetical protein
MRVDLKKISFMVKESLILKMFVMKVNGKTISHMGMGNRFLKKIKQCILENLKMVKNKVKVNSYGKLKMKTINKKH